MHNPITMVVQAYQHGKEARQKKQDEDQEEHARWRAEARARGKMKVTVLMKGNDGWPQVYRDAVDARVVGDSFRVDCVNEKGLTVIHWFGLAHLYSVTSTLYEAEDQA